MKYILIALLASSCSTKFYHNDIRCKMDESEDLEGVNREADAKSNVPLDSNDLAYKIAGLVKLSISSHEKTILLHKMLNELEPKLIEESMEVRMREYCGGNIVHAMARHSKEHDAGGEVAILEYLLSLVEANEEKVERVLNFQNINGSRPFDISLLNLNCVFAEWLVKKNTQNSNQLKIEKNSFDQVNDIIGAHNNNHFLTFHFDWKTFYLGQCYKYLECWNLCSIMEDHEKENLEILKKIVQNLKNSYSKEFLEDRKEIFSLCQALKISISEGHIDLFKRLWSQRDKEEIALNDLDELAFFSALVGESEIFKEIEREATIEAEKLKENLPNDFLKDYYDYEGVRDLLIPKIEKSVKERTRIIIPSQDDEDNGYSFEDYLNDNFSRHYVMSNICRLEYYIGMAAFLSKKDLFHNLLNRATELGIEVTPNFLIYSASAGGDLGIIERVLAMRRDNETIKSIIDSQKYNRQVLSSSIYFGHLEATRLLIEKGACVEGDFNSYSSKDSCPHSPMYFAIQSNSLNMVNLLIEAGADVEYLCQSVYGSAPRLLEDVGNNFMDGIAATLIAREQDNFKSAGIFKAAFENDNLNLVNLLWQRYEESLSNSDVYSKNELIFTAFVNKSLKAMQWVVQKLSEEEIKGHMGKRALIFASIRGWGGMVRELIEKGVKTYFLSDSDIAGSFSEAMLERYPVDKESGLIKEEKVLAIAALCGRLEIVEILAGVGAKTSSYIKDKSIAFYAIKGGNIDIVKYFINNNYMDKDTIYQCLLAAIEDENIEMINILKGKGVDLMTLLARACKKGNVDIVKECLKSKRKSQDISYELQLSFLAAIWWGHSKIVEMLLLEREVELKCVLKDKMVNEGRTREGLLAEIEEKEAESIEKILEGGIGELIKLRRMAFRHFDPMDTTDKIYLINLSLLDIYPDMQEYYYFANERPLLLAIIKENEEIISLLKQAGAEELKRGVKEIKKEAKELAKRKEALSF